MKFFMSTCYSFYYLLVIWTIATTTTTTLSSSWYHYFADAATDPSEPIDNENSASPCNICGDGYELGDLNGQVPTSIDSTQATTKATTTTMTTTMMMTCQELETLGLTGQLETTCSQWQSIAYEPCKCQPSKFVCTLCASGQEATRLGNLVQLTQGKVLCSTLNNAAGTMSDIEQCEKLQQAAVIDCGCPTLAPTTSPSTTPSFRPTLLNSNDNIMTPVAKPPTTTNDNVATSFATKNYSFMTNYYYYYLLVVVYIL